jgi:hypothetical protein
MSDSGNISDDMSLKDGEPKIKDIVLTSNIKLMFLGFGLGGIVLSILSMSITGILVFSICVVFIMDMMGMLDYIKKSKRDISKPKGYENIE